MSIKTPDDMKTGSIFATQTCGNVKVLQYVRADAVYVKFINTGYTIKTTSKSLRKVSLLRDPLAPTVFGVGCIGIGPHKAHEKGADTPIFRIWRAMLRRCYHRPENAKVQPSYLGCTVAPEWWNYQVFADWYVSSYPKDGKRYQLDKDVLYPECKFYSAETCSFVTQADNLAARKFKRDRDSA